MPLLVPCPACGMQVHVPDDAAGYTLCCSRPGCGAQFTAPARPAYPGSYGHQPPPEMVRRPGPHYPPRPPSYRRRPDERAMPPDTSLQFGLGIASLLVAAFGLIGAVAPWLGYFCLATGILALLLGLTGVIVAASQQRRGLAMPLAGLLLSLAPIIVGVIWIIWVQRTVRHWTDDFFGTAGKIVDKGLEVAEKKQKEQEEKQKELLYQQTGHPTAINRMIQIASALSGYEAKHKEFPASGGPKGNLSWRVHVLPFLGRDDLYKKFKLDEPWDSPANQSLLTQIPDIYAPVRADASVPAGYTFIQVFTKPGGSFPLSGKGPTLADIKDGTAKTFLVVEAGHPVPWTKPADVPYVVTGSLPKLGHTVPTGFHAAMFDGKAYFIRHTAPDEHLRLWIMPDDGRTAPLP